MDYQCVIYSAETVVREHDKTIVKCPTEDEAWEYIRDMERNTDNED